MKNQSNARRMLAMALKDFKALHVMMDPEKVDDEIFGFHVQQAVEKSIKAWLVHLNVDFPKTHDVRALVGILAQTGADVEGIWSLVEFNNFGVQFRYESYDDQGGLDRSDAVQRVKTLLDKVAMIMGEMKQ